MAALSNTHHACWPSSPGADLEAFPSCTLPSPVSRQDPPPLAEMGGPGALGANLLGLPRGRLGEKMVMSAAEIP